METEEVSSETKCGLLKQVLGNIRDTIINGPKPAADVLEPFQHLIHLRELFRDVAKELETRKILAKTKKDQVEKSRTHLDGLEYCKAVLQAEIDVCKVDVTDISDVLEEKVEIEWIHGFDEIKRNLSGWIEESKARKEVLNQKRREMEMTENKIETKRNLYKNQLPRELKKISENLISITGLFGVEPVYLLNPVRNPKLRAIYNYFQPLKQSKAISMQYSEEIISVKISITSTHPAFKFFPQIKCPIEQKNIEINFLTILDDTLVASVNRSSDMNNEEIFNRLVDNEASTKLFQNPKNEEERNNNNRFVRFRWLDDIANPRQNLTMNSYSLLKKIEDRVISLILTRYLLLSLKENKFLFYFRAIRQGENGTVHLKKFTVQSLNKLSFKEFEKNTFIPFWAKNMGEEESNQAESAPEIASPAQYLQDIMYGEGQQTQTNEYYKVVLNYYQNTIIFVIIIPHSYPEKQSLIKIVQMSKKREEKRYPVLPGNILTIENPVINNPSASEVRGEFLEKELNENISDLVRENYHFHVIYQINRLLTVLEDLVAKDSNSEFVVTKLHEY